MKEHDGYFLRSLTQRLFNVITWSTVAQDSIDALPPETLNARKDLHDLYARADVARLVLSGTSLFPEYPGYGHEFEAFHLFVGTVDAISDVGVRTYHTSDKTVPSSSFDKEYEDQDSPIQALRGWLGLIAEDGPEAPVILARLACLRWVLRGLQGTDEPTAYGELSDAMQSITRVYDVAYKFDLYVSPALTEMLSSRLRHAELS